MTEIGNRIFFAFGDTFGYDGDICRGVGGPNWRSNVFASTTDHNPADGVVLEDWLRQTDGKAIAVVEGAHQPPFTGEDGEQTKIPTAMVSVGNRIYLHYMSVHGFSQVGGAWDCITQNLFTPTTWVKLGKRVTQSSENAIQISICWR